MVKESDLTIESIVSKVSLDDKCAIDIMTRGPLCVKSKQNIGEVSKLMLDNKISSLPVVNDHDELIGSLSKTDIVKYYYENISSLEKSLEFFKASDMNQNLEEAFPDLVALKDINKKPVKAVMSNFVFAIKAETAVKNIIKEVLKEKIHHLYVTDKDGVLIGIISVIDVLKILVS